MSPTIISRRAALKALGFTSGVLLLAGCGGSSDNSAAPAAATSNPNAPEAKLSLSTKGSTPYFDNEKLEAPTGSKVTVTFKNGADASSNKIFNWVLVKPGKTLKVVNDAQSEGADTEYVKANDTDVIAHTKLVKPGESDTVTFDAPAPGDYPFTCTLPGYYSTMKGVLTVH